jgi:hypothetical protein
LDIWELSGASESWAEQLEQHQREKPVLALVSGLANSEWKPVQDFCEAKHVACWFPSVDVVPAGAAGSQFSLYFSAGIAVEAQVIASKLKADRARVVQLVANDPVARAGAAALRQALAANQGGGEQHAVLEVDASAGIAALTASLSGLGARDSVVLWLRQADLQGMVNLPQTTAQVFVSATLAGDERLELPVALRQHARLVQPLEVPHLREANLERLQSWLEGSRLPVVDLRMQSEIYFAAGSLQSTLRGMLNNLHADYLIERAEATLSGFEAIQVQEEIQAMMMGPMNKLPLSQAAATPSQVAAVAATSKAQRDHLEEMRMRGGTTVYPRLGLAQGQRFASKGAYLEPLNPNAPGVLGEPEWVVP